MNTPRVITNQAQQVVWRWDHAEPFGSNPPNENPSGLGTFTCNLRLPGQYFDKETNTHYNYYRDYDPSTGSYLQSDRLGVGGLLAMESAAEAAWSIASLPIVSDIPSIGSDIRELTSIAVFGQPPASRVDINLYGYVSGNPISMTDPLGLWSVTFGGFAGPGALVTFGQNPSGSGFMSLQFGFGIGAGISYGTENGVRLEFSVTSGQPDTLRQAGGYRWPAC